MKLVKRHWLRLILGVVAVLFLLAYVAAPTARAVSIAHPARSPVCCVTPAEFELSFRNVSFQTPAGLNVRGWYLPSNNGAAVIVAHGFLENRSKHLAPAAALARHGYGVLLIDLIAHGDSDGDTISLDGSEIVAAVNFLKTGTGHAAPRIGVLGFSLGGLVSLQAAAQSPDVRAVIADGPLPVSTLEDRPPVQDLAEGLWLPFDWAEWQALAVQGVSPHVSTIEALHQIAPRPVLLITGGQNRGEQRVVENYAAHAPDNVSRWEIPEAGHIGGWAARPAEYQQRMMAFFEQGLK